MCFTNWSSVLNLDLFWKHVFSYGMKSYKISFLRHFGEHAQSVLQNVDKTLSENARKKYYQILNLTYLRIFVRPYLREFCEYPPCTVNLC